jgi:3-hydroxyacyl-CoA dehydrogenase/3-hydroxy-2-methylbutyryl-CoA dehydrogenase
MQISGSVGIVTGGASGLGEATARRLVAAGARVVILDMNERLGAQLAGELGPGCRFGRADVASEADVKAAIALAVREFGRLDVAVNCAGIGVAEKTVGKNGPHPLDLFKKVVEVNLVGTFNVLRLAAAQMATNAPNADGERGVVVNTASIAAFDGQVGQAAYAASKGGVVSLALPVARELARSGIRVCTLAPGLFATPILMAIPDEGRCALESAIPFPSRLGRPSEYAQLVQHVVENPMLNGEVIRIDACLRMAPR